MLILRKTDVHKALIFKSKNSSSGRFLGASTHANIIEFSNLLLQLRKQRSGRKTVYNFCIILILKGIMKF